MSVLPIIALVVGISLEPVAEEVAADPHAAVGVMYSLLAKSDFAVFYDTHCHEHLRDQIGREEFIEYMKGEAGSAIVRLFSEVHEAIRQKKGVDVLIARPQDDPSQYEYILVQVKKRRTRKGQQWHLELQKEDGQWKLMDTD